MRRAWRRCETCEWWDGGCFNQKTGIAQALDMIMIHLTIPEELDHYRTMLNDPDGWCSEWKSDETETCGMCEWYVNDEGDGKHTCFNNAVNRFMFAPGDDDPGDYGYNRRAVIAPDAGACEYFSRNSDEQLR